MRASSARARCASAFSAFVKTASTTLPLPSAGRKEAPAIVGRGHWRWRRVPSRHRPPCPKSSSPGGASRGGSPRTWPCTIRRARGMPAPTVHRVRQVLVHGGQELLKELRLGCWAARLSRSRTSCGMAACALAAASAGWAAFLLFLVLALKLLVSLGHPCVLLSGAHALVAKGKGPHTLEGA